VLLRRAIVAGSRVKGRAGQRRRGFGNGSHVSPHVRSNSNATTSVRCLCNPSTSNRDAVLRDSPRSRGKDEPRHGQRPATSGGTLASNREWVRRSAGAAAPQGVSAVVDSRPKPLGFRVSRPGSPVTSLLARWQCPGFGITWQGVSLADRVHDCVVRARVTDCEDRQQKAPDGRSVEPASAMSKRAPGHIATGRSATWLLPKVKRTLGPGGTGSQRCSRRSWPSEQLPGQAPREASRCGRDRRRTRVLAPLALGRFTSRRAFGLFRYERASPKRSPARPRSGVSWPPQGGCGHGQTPPSLDGAVGCFTTRAKTRFVSSFAETRFRTPRHCRHR
jgi:hypothetical protein